MGFPLPEGKMLWDIPDPEIGYEGFTLPDGMTSLPVPEERTDAPLPEAG